MHLLIILLFVAQNLLGAGWPLEEMLNVKLPETALVSPDNCRILYTVKGFEGGAQKNSWQSKLFVSSIEGTSPKQFVNKEIVRVPSWSPDGTLIAFLAKKENKAALWIIPSDGGEALPLTDGTSDVVNFKFSPDSKKIAFLAKDPQTKEEKEKIEQKTDAYVVGEKFTMTHLWICDLATKQLERITEGNFTIETGFSGHDFDWSPDGKEIAFPHMPTPELDNAIHARIWIVNLISKNMRELQTNSFAIKPFYSPDGKWIAYVTADLPVKWHGIQDIAIISPQGGEPKKLAATFNRSLAEEGSIIGWSKESLSVFVIDTERTKNQVYEIPIDGSPAKKLDFGDLFVDNVTLNASKETFAFVAENTSTPPEVFVKTIETPCTQITQINKNLDTSAIGKTEVIRYPGEDGLEIEALLTYPAHYTPDQKYPLLLIIHGGPTSLFQEKFIGTPYPYPQATFSSDGFALLRCNIRGSNGYGEEFRYKNYRDWGGKDFLDLMHGVDFVIKQGVADKERLGVMGWSYGGYMTAWAITQTDRFKAASMGAGVADLISMVGTSDIPSFLPFNFDAEFWDNYDLYLKRSAIFYVGNVKTPTLIQHGREDERVSLGQAYEFYEALKRRHVPVKFIIYPRCGHCLTEPKLLLEAARANFDWFTHYLK